MPLVSFDSVLLPPMTPATANIPEGDKPERLSNTTYTASAAWPGRVRTTELCAPR